MCMFGDGRVASVHGTKVKVIHRKRCRLVLFYPDAPARHGSS